MNKVLKRLVDIDLQPLGLAGDHDHHVDVVPFWHVNLLVEFGAPGGIGRGVTDSRSG